MKAMKSPSAGKTEMSTTEDLRDCTNVFAIVSWFHSMSSTRIYHVARIIRDGAGKRVFAIHVENADGGFEQFSSKKAARAHAREVKRRLGGHVEPTVYQEKIGTLVFREVEPT